MGNRDSIKASNPRPRLWVPAAVPTSHAAKHDSSVATNDDADDVPATNDAAKLIWLQMTVFNLMINTSVSSTSTEYDKLKQLTKCFGRGEPGLQEGTIKRWTDFRNNIAYRMERKTR